LYFKEKENKVSASIKFNLVITRKTTAYTLSLFTKVYRVNKLTADSTITGIKKTLNSFF